MTGHGVEPSFIFNEASHTYSRGGIILPGATRCLDHAGITDYANVRADVLERRSQLGKAVHSACHYHDEKDLDYATLSDVQKGYLDSWCDWLAARGFICKAIEHQQIATLMGMDFGMRIDRYGFLDKVPTIVELKITRTIQPAHAIQTALYAAGYTDPVPVGGTIDAFVRFSNRQRVAVQLRPDGKKAHERFFDNRQDFFVAWWALGITHWKLQQKFPIEEIGEAA